jgi:hypothetical protein
MYEVLAHERYLAGGGNVLASASSERKRLRRVDYKNDTVLALWFRSQN